MKCFFYLDKDKENSLEKFYTSKDISSLFIVRKEETNEFIVFNDPSEWVDYRDTLPESERRFHEIIYGHVKQKFRLDIDFKHKDRKLFAEQLDFIEEKVVLTFRALYFKLTGWEICKSDLLRAVSVGNDKVGCHLILPYFLFEGIDEVLVLYNELKKQINIETDLVDVELDGAVFNKKANLRLIGCHKGGRFKKLSRVSEEDRGFDAEDSIITYYKKEYRTLPRLFNRSTREINKSEINVVEEDIDEICKMLPQDILDGFKPGKFVQSGSVLTFTRIRPSYCDICDKEHENENSLIAFITPDGYVSRACRRNDFKIKIDVGKLDIDVKEEEDLTKQFEFPIEECENSSLKSFVQQFNSCPKPLENDKIKKSAKHISDDVPKKTRKLISYCADPNKSLKYINEEIEKIKEKSKAHVYSERYVAPYPPGATTLFVRAQMKMGKTKQLKEYIDNNFTRGDKIVIISFRRTFSNSLQGDFKGFKLYNLIGGSSININTHPRLIIQVESLHRIDLNDFPDVDLVVMDESESIIGQFNSGNFRDTLDSSFGVFNALVSRCKRLVCIDANIGQRTLNTIELLRPEHKIHFEWNKYNINSDNEFYLSADLGAWLGNLKDRLNSQKNIAVVTNSIKASEGLERWIKTKFSDRNIIVYNSKTLESIKREHFADVNKFWVQYDTLIYTPTISAGVSFTEAHFDEIYGYFIDMSCDVETCHQMLGRIRNVKSKKYFIYLDGNGSYLPTETRAIERSIIYERQMIEKAKKELHFELNANLEPSYFKSRYYKVWLENVRIQNLSRNLFVSRFVGMTYLSGYKVKLLNRKDDTDNRACRDEFKLTKKDLEYEENKLIAESKLLTEDEYLILRDKQRLLVDIYPEERAELCKFYLTKRYDWADKPMTPAWVKVYLDTKVQEHFRNLKDLFREESINESIRTLQLEDGIKHDINISNNYDAKDLNTIYRSQKHIIALGIIELFGWPKDPLNCGEPIDYDNVVKLIEENMEEGINLNKNIPIWTTIFGLKYIGKLKKDDIDSTFKTLCKIVESFYGIIIREKDGFVKLQMSKNFVYSEDAKNDKKPYVPTY